MTPNFVTHDSDASTTTTNNNSPTQNGVGNTNTGLSIANGDISRRRLSGSVDIEIPVSVAPTEGFNNENGFLGANKENSISSVKIEIQRERTYIDDCLCSVCYTCSCCTTSYLDSPIRRLWHNSRHYTKLFIEHKYFEGVILFLIAFSSLTLVSYFVTIKFK